MVTVFWYQSSGFTWSFHLNLTSVKLLPSFPAWIFEQILSESSQFISSSPGIDMNPVESECRLESSNVNGFLAVNQSLNLFQSVWSYLSLEGLKWMCCSLLLTEDPASSFIALFIAAKWFKDKTHRWRVPSYMPRPLVNPRVDLTDFIRVCSMARWDQRPAQYCWLLWTVCFPFSNCSWIHGCFSDRDIICWT